MTRTSTYTWSCASRSISIGTRTLIMGVLNVTPDSFSDGGAYANIDRAVQHALDMHARGADMIDIGGESSRPGAEPVSEAEELNRTIPVIRALRVKLDCPISIDTTKSAVAKAAIQSGADIINDISACRLDPDMIPLTAETGAGVVLMHMQGDPRSMQKNPQYTDVVHDIIALLQKHIDDLLALHIKPDQLIVDPGIGFGKSVADNYELLRRLHEFKTLDRPILVGPSRKSFIGKLLDLPPQERLEGTLAAAVAAIMNGADILRVHDVQAVQRAVRVTDAITGKLLVDKL
ncbi:MAG: dihydropteroate synthase [candidate division KSB1 bacterium]|nr:dihydropteroate synthase [candidate division KSB1 bacterium]